MPKIVDHEKMKNIIAEATWKIISEKGIHHATSRTIAKEAGLSQGALRHYFAKQESLLAFAMELVKEKVLIRLRNLNARELAPQERIVEYLLELVPTDEQTLLEMEVWFAFVTYGKTQKGFDTNYEDLQNAIKNCIIYLKNEGLLSTTDEEKEQEKLYAFMNGMALNLYLEPDKINRTRSKEMIQDYIHWIIR
ncbi:TetR/AcrR family transcriptional regulator [Paenibacillus illinoisensis]|uniref:HTH-type transcriptional regulator PksA n=1 Tax=Paenibacillus illinoisensis TaxID=59845 RepID=A0A2W0C4I5_9BACL|nr:TetR/AcrR family transcriptional regulator [Paenibacillus illinoisensis]PYY26967.1 HTH-type transcriptional regulator PksA [Paenibacillus illinoisensis]